MLTCDICGSLNFKTVDSRNEFAGKTYLKRRRECIDCGCRFTTVEINKEEYMKLKEKAKKVDEIAEKALTEWR